MVRVYLVASSFMMAAVPAPATPVMGEDQLSARVALERAMDQASAEMLKPGPVRAGWEKGGVDIYKLLEAAPGGSAQNYLLSVDKDGERTITIVRPPSSASYLPESWKLVLRSGQQQSRSAHVTILNLDGPFFIVGWESSRPVGDAFCSSGGIGGDLRQDLDVKESEIPSYLIPVMFNGLVKRMQAFHICWRFDRKGDGYAVTYFLEDGRTLPAMNESQEQVTIVPAGPVQALLSKETAQK